MVIRSTLKEDFTSSSGLPTTLKDLHVPAHMSTDQIEEAPDDISSCYSGLVPSLSAMNIKSKPLGFLDLPTEIRIQIYKYFFPASESISKAAIMTMIRPHRYATHPSISSFSAVKSTMSRFQSSSKKSLFEFQRLQCVFGDCNVLGTDMITFNV